MTNSAAKTQSLPDVVSELSPVAEAGRHFEVVEALSRLAEARGPSVLATLSTHVNEAGPLRPAHLDAAETLWALRRSWAAGNERSTLLIALVFFERLVAVSPPHAEVWFWENCRRFGSMSSRFADLYVRILPSRLSDEQYAVSIQRMLSLLEKNSSFPVWVWRRRRSRDDSLLNATRLAVGIRPHGRAMRHRRSCA
jgi:hypothetical protein